MSQILPSTYTPDDRPRGGYGSIVKQNVQERFFSFRSSFRLGELSGSLGDLGTLLPNLLSLALTGQVDLQTSADRELQELGA